MSAIQNTISAASFAAVSWLSMAGSAQALTLDTRAIDAKAVFAFSQQALDAMSAADTFISGLGTVSNAAPTVSSTGDLLPAFNMPVSKVDVSLGLPPFSPLVSPNSGEASGAALQITRGARSVTLANFVIDYSKDLVLADITANGVTTKATSLYSFDATNLNIGLNGLTLNMHQTLSNLVFTPTALSTFGTGLNLAKSLQAPLSTIDFGTITVDVNGALRSPINATPFTVAVPELPKGVMLLLGMVGIAVVSRRKQAN